MAIEREEALRLLTESGTKEEPAKVSGAADPAAAGKSGGTDGQAAGVATSATAGAAEGEKKEEAANPLAEYGVRAGEDASALDNANQQIEYLNQQLLMTQSELDAERSKKADPLMMMTEEELNEKVEDLADKGKTMEAVKLMADWREAQTKKARASGVSPQEMLERNQRELLRYANQAPENKALLTLLADEKVAARIKPLAGVIRPDRQGAADVLHLMCLGIKSREIYQKGYEAGRASAGVSSPSGGVSKSAAVKSPAAAGSGAKKQTVSSMLRSGMVPK